MCFALFHRSESCFSRGVCTIANKLVEADSLMTWVRDGAVKLRMTDSAQGSRRPMTVMAALKETSERCPNRIALGEFHCKLTYKLQPPHALLRSHI